MDFINHQSKFGYTDVFLKIPSLSDVRGILKLHEHKHGVPGMLGSLDCMQVTWKNCPVAFQGQYQGKEETPTIAFEAVCDNNLFIWHGSVGYPGSLNDVNVFNLSPLSSNMIDGTLHDLEKGLEPFRISGDDFLLLYMLVDGIYPRYARFVQTIPHPINDKESRFSSWQESARKDIERAFGMLQNRFHILAKPLHAMSSGKVCQIVKACTILHNMYVKDYVSGFEADKYRPEDSIFLDVSVNEGPTRDFQSSDSNRTTTVNGLSLMSETWQSKMTQRWSDLDSLDNHLQLQCALVDHLNRRRKR